MLILIFCSKKWSKKPKNRYFTLLFGVKYKKTVEKLQDLLKRGKWRKIMDQREEGKLKSSTSPKKERKMVKKMDQGEESKLKKLQKPSKERKMVKKMDQREESKLKSSNHLLSLTGKMAK